MKDLFWPDHSSCITCKKPISWDDYSYIHDDTGFADCGIALDMITIANSPLSEILEIYQWQRFEGATARPMELLLGYV